MLTNWTHQRVHLVLLTFACELVVEWKGWVRFVRLKYRKYANLRALIAYLIFWEHHGQCAGKLDPSTRSSGAIDAGNMPGSCACRQGIDWWRCGQLQSKYCGAVRNPIVVMMCEPLRMYLHALSGPCLASLPKLPGGGNILMLYINWKRIKFPFVEFCPIEQKMSERKDMVVFTKLPT